MGEVLSAAMFVVTILVVLAGYPVAFTLAGTALAFGGLGIGLGLFEPSLLTALASRYFGTMTNEVLVAVPLFVFMGVMLERSKIAEQLLMIMGELFGAVRGGLGFSVILVGALLAASTGIVGATVVTMGLLSLPVMTQAGYDPKLSTGAICASGTLGQIIPPSTVLIFMGDILQGANQQAQLEMGNFSPDPLSVGQLFAGAILPGLMLVILYMVWIGFRAITDPDSCPALELDPAQRATLPRRVLGALVPPLVLIFAVLGSILAGVATPTESASVGAVGAMILAAFKSRMTVPILREVTRSTMMISSMVFVILLGASVFSLVFRGLGGEDLVFDILASIPGGTAGAVFIVMLVIFFLGFFLDTFEIIFITVPIAAPVLFRLGVDPIWLGVLIGMNLQTSFLTPPFGFALFYLRGVADSAIKTLEIYRGALPFVGLQIVGIALIWLVPDLATWLPDILFGNDTFAAPINTGSELTTRPGLVGDIDQFQDLLGDPASGTAPPIDTFENLLPE
jgi:tripartite ATP-independent transporter DctM subunit